MKKPRKPSDFEDGALFSNFALNDAAPIIDWHPFFELRDLFYSDPKYIRKLARWLNQWADWAEYQSKRKPK